MIKSISLAWDPYISEERTLNLYKDFLTSKRLNRPINQTITVDEMNSFANYVLKTNCAKAVEETTKCKFFLGQGAIVTAYAIVTFVLAGASRLFDHQINHHLALARAGNGTRYNRILLANQEHVAMVAAVFTTFAIGMGALTFSAAITRLNKNNYNAICDYYQNYRNFCQKISDQNSKDEIIAKLKDRRSKIEGIVAGALLPQGYINDFFALLDPAGSSSSR